MPSILPSLRKQLSSLVTQPPKLSYFNVSKIESLFLKYVLYLTNSIRNSFIFPCIKLDIALLSNVNMELRIPFFSEIISDGSLQQL